MTTQPLFPDDTDTLTFLDVATATALANRGGILKLNGLVSLTPDAAAALALFRGDSIALSGLRSLPDAVAKALLPVANRICIGDTGNMESMCISPALLGEDLSVAVAELLAASTRDPSYSAPIYIPPHTTISPPAAARLARIAAPLTELTLASVTCITDALCDSLKPCRAILCFPSLMELTPSAARQFADAATSLTLGPTTTLSIDSLHQLSSSHGRLSLGMPALSDEEAAILSQHPGFLTLSGLQALGDTPGHLALAEKLVRQCHADSDCGHDDVCLSALRIAPDAASILATKKYGAIHFQGLVMLDDAVAAALLPCKARITLSTVSLQSLSSKAVDLIDANAEPHYWLSALRTLHGWTPKLQALSRLESVSLSGRSKTIGQLPNFGDANAFPNLRQVSLDQCPHLKEFVLQDARVPPKTLCAPLSLSIRRCKSLRRIAVRTSRLCAAGLELLDLPACRDMTLSLPDLRDLTPLRHLQGLTSLTLTNCPQLDSLDGIELLKSLEHLSLQDCPQLTSVSNWPLPDSLSYLELLGTTGVHTMHGLRPSEFLSISVEHASTGSSSAGVGIPPWVVQNYCAEEGLGALARFKNAIIECSSCGGRTFSGQCHGHYTAIARVVAKKTIACTDGDLESTASKSLSGMADSLRAHGLRSLDFSCPDTDHTSFSLLRARVYCSACGASFTLPTEAPIKRIDAAAYSTRDTAASGLADSNPRDDAQAYDDWSAFAAMHDTALPPVDLRLQSIGMSRMPPPSLILNRAPARSRGDNTPVDPTLCPVCQACRLELSVFGTARSEEGGKFGGAVRISNTTWGKLHTCIHVDWTDVAWESGRTWEQPPKGQLADLACADRCFAALASSPDHIPELALAALAASEALQAAPDPAYVSRYVAGLIPHAGGPRRLVEAAKRHLAQLRLREALAGSHSLAEQTPDLLETCRARARELLTDGLVAFPDSAANP